MSVFGIYLIVFPLRTLLSTFIVLLVVGPIILMVFTFFLYRQTVVLNGRWVSGARGYGRFWLALIVSAALHVGLDVGYLKLNPYARFAFSFPIHALTNIIDRTRKLHIGRSDRCQPFLHWFCCPFDRSELRATHPAREAKVRHTLRGLLCHLGTPRRSSRPRWHKERLWALLDRRMERISAGRGGSCNV
jgi:hypothetical protein